MFWFLLNWPYFFHYLWSTIIVSCHLESITKDINHDKSLTQRVILCKYVNLKFFFSFSCDTGSNETPHVRTHTHTPKLCAANYLNTTVCILVHIHTHLHWLQMQYILLLLSKTLITLHSLISHKYSESRAVIRAYIYPTWLGENSVQCWPQGWASLTQRRCHERKPGH